MVTAYEPHRRYAVSPTELSPERWSGRTRSSRTARGHVLSDSYEVTRPVGGIGWLVIERLFGAHDRTPDRAAASRTMAALKAPQRPSTGAGSVDDHDVMVIYAG